VDAQDVILDLGIILAVGLAAIPVAARLRIPFMLLLVVAGILLGPSVGGVVDMPLGSTGVDVLLTLGVSIILFHGGLTLSLRVLRQVAVGLGMLVIPGVVMTTVICGVVAHWAFDVPLAMGLLIGAAIAPTDPAILIPLFERLGLRQRLRQTIVAESALNDPTGAVIAFSLLAVVETHEPIGLGPVADFFGELGISVAIGAAAGLILSVALSRTRWGLWRESAGIAVLAIVALTFVSEQFAGAESGYLGPFIAGVIVGNMDLLRLGMHGPHQRDMEVVVRAMADMMAIFVFVVLGANLPWSAIGADWLPALLVVLTLIVIARPLVVAVCLGVDRRAGWYRSERVFMSWTRETGVVPAALAGIIASHGVAEADLVLVTVAMAILVTLALQASTKPMLARRLDLIEPAARDGAG